MLTLLIERVKTRVQEGGHNIPEEVIIRRYKKGIKNLTKDFVNLFDFWLVIDNSSRPFTFIAEGNEGVEIVVYNDESWNKIKSASNEKGQ